ncbi:hypothetical protein KFK09_011984 [Dendrobium nobile]|uniref:Uncharacterized protein n=1 Tax=Dendrobium nobile TaxID=94219 RepID=A0A8T3BG27_DENNO|nr:hypothetical protein KFK09_011984 [Dendrobium nobile]
MAEPSSFRHIIKQLIGISDHFSSPYGMDSADAKRPLQNRFGRFHLAIRSICRLGRNGIGSRNRGSVRHFRNTSFCLIASALAILDVVNRDELFRFEGSFIFSTEIKTVSTVFAIAMRDQGRLSTQATCYP